MNARTETLAEVINWLGDEADREWERAKDGLSDGYGGFDAYMRAISTVRTCSWTIRRNSENTMKVEK